MEQKGEIKIQTRALNEHVEIKFADTGCGIPQENLNRIFDPFFTTKPVGKGTGLGLNVSYNIIAKHNGTILVESAQGKGTTFTIQLPA
jgi:signal transduction histidine kinase